MGVYVFCCNIGSMQINTFRRLPVHRTTRRRNTNYFHLAINWPAERATWRRQILFSIYVF